MWRLNRVTIMMTVAVMAAILELVVGTPAYNVGIMAKKKGTSAFERGMKDGADICTHPDGYHWYILGHKKRFKYHSEEFNKDYVKGFCSTSHGDSDADEATINC